MKRSEVLKLLGLSGAGALVGGIFSRLSSVPVGDRTIGEMCGISPDTTNSRSPSLLRRLSNAYGSATQPPTGFVEGSLMCFGGRAEDAAAWRDTQPTIIGRSDLPLVPALGAGGKIEIEAAEQDLFVARDTIFPAWTFNGQLPGPVIRTREGSSLEVVFRNRTSTAHSLHFHGRHGPQEDGWEPVAAGADRTYRLKAHPAGIHPYHCHVPPIGLHTGKGLYGLMIVDPPEGRPPAYEIVLILSGIDLKGSGRNDLYTWNGIAGFYERFPVKVRAGELVRVYLLNMTEYDPVMTFHIHGVTFDIYRSGTRAAPDEHTDVVTLGMSERAVLEFRLPERGRYMFHPHQTHMAERGAMGWFVAI